MQNANIRKWKRRLLITQFYKTLTRDGGVLLRRQFEGLQKKNEIHILLFTK